jgi:hypothetical protein
MAPESGKSGEAWFAALHMKTLLPARRSFSSLPSGHGLETAVGAKGRWGVRDP